jgi:hypothetical protein
LPEIRDVQSCSIQVTTLRATPFSLEWGSSINARIVATNIYGDSDQSVEGNGAVMITYSDPPINLQESVHDRTPTSITFGWDNAPMNGGSTVIDYRITSDQSTGTDIVLADDVTTPYYTATGLTFGVTYAFKVEARNEFGHSS